MRPPFQSNSALLSLLLSFSLRWLNSSGCSPLLPTSPLLWMYTFSGLNSASRPAGVVVLVSV